MPNNTHDLELPRTELQDWYDFLRTDRKIIARRRANRRMEALEVTAMRAAFEMVSEGKISIITKIEPQAFGPGPMVVYVAERVK